MDHIFGGCCLDGAGSGSQGVAFRRILPVLAGCRKTKGCKDLKGVQGVPVIHP